MKGCSWKTWDNFHIFFSYTRPVKRAFPWNAMAVSRSQPSLSPCDLARMSEWGGERSEKSEKGMLKEAGLKMEGKSDLLDRRKRPRKRRLLYVVITCNKFSKIFFECKKKEHAKLLWISPKHHAESQARELCEMQTLKNTGNFNSGKTPYGREVREKLSHQKLSKRTDHLNDLFTISEKRLKIN